MSAKWRQQQDRYEQRILAYDDTYKLNVTRLNQSKHAGKLTAAQFQVHLDWLQQSAMRKHKLRIEGKDV